MSQANLLEIFRFLWLVPLLLSLLGFFLSLWIIIPASTFSLLPLGVGAPELSPWLIVINAIALLLTVLVHNSWLSAIIFICSLLGLILSLLPLLQLPAANGKFTAEMTAVLGTDYLQAVPQALQNQMRPQPFAIADVFRGIPIKEVRIERGIIFANPDQVDLKLNLYRPPLTGKYPALIIIYGGAWREGNPDSYETYSSYMAAQGYSVIAIDYRHGTPETKEFIVQNFPTGIVPLNSESNIDYQPLQRLLADQDFQKADLVTIQKLCELAGASAIERKWLYFTEVGSIAIADFRTIDQLWLVHSEGKFGFSVQRKIWLALGQDFGQLWSKINWKTGNSWTRYPNEFTWDLTAPRGHLPLSNQLRGVRVIDAIFKHPAWSVNS